MILNLVKFIFVIVGTLLITFYIVHTNIGLILARIKQIYLKIAKLFAGGTSFEIANEGGIYAKIFMNYLQIISVLRVYNLEMMPTIIIDFIISIANPIEMLIIS